MSLRSSAVVFDTDKIEEAMEKAVQVVSANISYTERPMQKTWVFQ